MSTTYTGVVRPLFDLQPTTTAGVANLGSFFLFALEKSPQGGNGAGTDKVFLEVEATTTNPVMRGVVAYDYITLVVTGTQTGKYLNIGAVTDNGSHSYSATITNSD